MRPTSWFLLAFVLSPATSSAQDAFKIEPLKGAPPPALAAPVREAMEGQGYRVLNPEGKPYAEIWLRKEIPASGKPAGPQGAILYPVLTEGELIGSLRFVEEGQDYRDQAIPPGAYTLRYGLQPVNGDHLGVSKNRDYALLLPASKDQAVADLPKKPLDERSAEAAGTSHPAVLLMLAPPSPSPETPGMLHDESLNTWGAILSLPLAVKGAPGIVGLPVQLVVSGAKMD